jgi:hypothetical protein
MGVRRIAWCFVGALGVVIVLALAHGPHRAGQLAGMTASSDSAMPPANIPLPPGEWEATGVVTKVLPPGLNTNEPEGEILKRPWTFRTVCHESCRTMFLRQTLYGPSRTSLVRHGSVYVANFPPVTVPCFYWRGWTGPRPPYGKSYDSYRLARAGGHTEIVAIEHRLSTGCEGETSDVTRWRAARTPPAGEGRTTVADGRRLGWR